MPRFSRTVCVPFLPFIEILDLRNDFNQLFAFFRVSQEKNRKGDISHQHLHLFHQQGGSPRGRSIAWYPTLSTSRRPDRQRRGSNPCAMQSNSKVSRDRVSREGKSARTHQRALPFSRAHLGFYSTGFSGCGCIHGRFCLYCLCYRHGVCAFGCHSPAWMYTVLWNVGPYGPNTNGRSCLLVAVSAPLGIF